jgi:site-specific DNA-methyltransferase (adenine-specific)
MPSTFSCERFSILRGNAMDLLKQLQTKVDCVITSPPYYNQRDYGSSSSELGRESSVGQYLANLVAVFKAIPLNRWASVWVNIGDKRGKKGELLRIPHLFANAMAEAGFFLIDEVVWAKESVQVNGESIGHCMIEPAVRRLNGGGHEPFYRFVLDPKQAWSDTCAVRIPRRNVDDIRYLPEELMMCHTSLQGRNLTNVWNISSGQTKESHYAVFPPALIERPVAMSCPLEITEQGPKRRKVLMVPYEESRPVKRAVGKYTKSEEEIRLKSGRQDTGREYIPRKPVTVGWEPELPAIRRGVVLDPFCGSATVGEVALKLGRNFIGIELYSEYAEIAEERCREANRIYEAGNSVTLNAESFLPRPIADMEFRHVVEGPPVLENVG